MQAAAIGAYPRSNSVSFVIGDHAYVGMGYNESIGGLGRLTDFWTFCVDSGWTQVQDFPGAARTVCLFYNDHLFGERGLAIGQPDDISTCGQSSISADGDLLDSLEAGPVVDLKALSVHVEEFQFRLFDGG